MSEPGNRKSNLPPEPGKPNASLPDQTEMTFVSTDHSMPLLASWVDSGGWMIDPKNGGSVFLGGQLQPRGTVINVINPPPRPYTINLYQYFKKIARECITPGALAGTQSISTTHGVTDTTTQQISLEIGVSVDGLSDKLSAMFSESVQIDNSTTTAEDYLFPADPDLYMDTTWWRNGYCMKVLDQNGNPWTWANSNVIAGIKPDWNSSTEWQSHINPPPWITTWLSSDVISQTTKFDRNQILVP
jgi:hypothetical protein